MVDENGEEIEFEDDSDDLEENAEATYMDEQEVVQQDSDEWQDEDGEDEEMEVDQKTKKRSKKEKKEAKEKVVPV